jgi:hypothetical protein
MLDEVAEPRNRGGGRAQAPRLLLELGPSQGKHKAQVFSAALGLGADDAEELREMLLSAARSEEAVTGEEDEYGKRYVPDFEMRTAVGTATVRSRWIVRHGEDFPRLTSCYVV